MKIKTEEGTEFEISIIAASLVIGAIGTVTYHAARRKYDRWTFNRHWKKHCCPTKAEKV